MPEELELLLIGRFVGSLFFKPATVQIVEGTNKHRRIAGDWNEFACVHQARRDRSGGRKGGKGQPKVGYLCTRKEAWSLLDVVCSLGYKLRETKSLAGIPDDQNPYQDDDSSLPRWTRTSDTP